MDFCAVLYSVCHLFTSLHSTATTVFTVLDLLPICNITVSLKTKPYLRTKIFPVFLSHSPQLNHSLCTSDLKPTIALTITARLLTLTFLRHNHSCRPDRLHAFSKQFIQEFPTSTQLSRYFRNTGNSWVSAEEVGILQLGHWTAITVSATNLNIDSFRLRHLGLFIKAPIHKRKQQLLPFDLNTLLSHVIQFALNTSAWDSTATADVHCLSNQIFRFSQ